jgi:XTP/dITP diphosphohydrolase
MRLIVASANPGKLREIRRILDFQSLEVVSMADAGFTGDIEETGETFEENAFLKARAIAARYPADLVLADDSGLEVEALGGEPGVRSARYAGENATTGQKIDKLLRALKEVPTESRGARFVCTMALVRPGGEVVSTGECRGRIAETSRGENGFGYDPVFLVADRDYRLTMAELPEDEKNTLSHRRRALDGMKEMLGKILAGGFGK